MVVMVVFFHFQLYRIGKKYPLLAFVLEKTKKINYIFIFICFCVRQSSHYPFTGVNRAQKLLAGDGARDDTAFIQPDKFRINTKSFILDATHHVTVRC
jgi:hypothetical protein